jgi:hypothetical protein
LTLALERMFAPVTVPAQPNDESDPTLDISVVFTTVEPTLAALRAAGNLAAGLGGRISLIVLQIVPYPLPLASPAVPVAFNERHLRVIAGDARVDTSVTVYLCRDAMETLRSVLTAHSLVIIGSGKAWWPTREKRLAAKLRHLGHQVVVTETEKE